MKRFLRLFLFLCAAAFAGGPAGAEPLRVRDVLAMEGAALDGSNPCTVTARVTFVMSWLPGSVIVTDPRAPDGPAVYATDRLYGPILAQGFENLRAGDLVEMTAHPVAMQEEQLGTGHAVQCAMPALEGFYGHVLVCCGDMPLMRRETCRALCLAHLQADAQAVDTS